MNQHITVAFQMYYRFRIDQYALYGGITLFLDLHVFYTCVLMNASEHIYIFVVTPLSLIVECVIFLAALTICRANLSYPDLLVNH